jgi:hypothetical protein
MPYAGQHRRRAADDRRPPRRDAQQTVQQDGVRPVLEPCHTIVPYVGTGCRQFSVEARIGIPIDVRQHDALWGNARGFQDIPGGGTEFEVAGNRDVCASVRLAGSLENTTFEGRDAPVPCADLYDARANPRRLLPRAGVSVPSHPSVMSCMKSSASSSGAVLCTQCSGG